MSLCHEHCLYYLIPPDNTLSVVHRELVEQQQ